MVPVAVNQLAFVASLVVLFWITDRLAGKVGATVAVVLAATLKADIWVSLNAMSEPLTILASMLFVALLLGWLDLTTWERSRKSLLLGAASLLAASIHYVGWGLAGIAGLVGIACIVQPISADSGARGVRRLIRPGACILLAAFFPVAWMALNWRLNSSPLYFIEKAAQFHADYVGAYSIQDRLFGPLQLWVGQSKIPVLLGAAGLLMAAFRHPRRALEIGIPFLGILLLIEVSSLKTWSMPYLYTRYTVVLTWMVLPFAGYIVNYTVRLGRGVRAAVALAVGVSGSLVGIAGSHQYSNWVSSDVRNVARYLYLAMETDASLRRVVVESFGNWGDQAIDVVTGVPDRFVFLPHSESSDKDLWHRRCMGQCVFVIRDYDTLWSMRDELLYLYSSGELFVVRPDSVGGLGSSLARAASRWKLVSTGFFLPIPPSTVVFGYVDPDPSRGAEVRIETYFPEVRSTCVSVRMDVADFYDIQEWPGRFVHQILINDSVVWSKDVSGNADSGWGPVQFEAATGERGLRIEARVVAIGAPEKGWNWGKASRMGVRDFHISGCPGDTLGVWIEDDPSVSGGRLDGAKRMVFSPPEMDGQRFEVTQP